MTQNCPNGQGGVTDGQDVAFGAQKRLCCLLRRACAPSPSPINEEGTCDRTAVVTDAQGAGAVAADLEA